jgi:D-alanyl-D-alanine carboxypeptidase
MRARRLALFLLCVLSSFCLAFGPPVLTDGDLARRRFTPQQLYALKEVPPPELTAAAALLANVRTGDILYARNEHEKRPMASFAKMVTAIVALERGKLEKEYRVQNEDLAVWSAAGLNNGELLSLRDLLFILLIPSDNAAAMTIARSLGKDVNTFVGWMNELVARWGLQETHFTNPHGLDSKNAYMSAHDAALIAYHALSNPVFADIVRRPEAIVAGRRLISTNKLLNTYPGTIGVKTGTTDKAGECLVVVVERPAGKVVAVVMGSQDRFTDMVLLLDYYYANYAELRVELLPTDQNRYQDAAGRWHELYLNAPLTLLVKPWQVAMASFYRRLDELPENPDPARPVGALVVQLAEQTLTEVPLYAR